MIHLDVGDFAEARIAEIKGHLFRVQCKAAWSIGNGSIRFNTASSNDRHAGKTYSGEIDIFASYSVDTDSVYILPIELASGLTCTLRVTLPKNNQYKKVRFANDYLLEKFIQQFDNLP